MGQQFLLCGIPQDVITRDFLLQIFENSSHSDKNSSRATKTSIQEPKSFTDSETRMIKKLKSS